MKKYYGVIEATETSEWFWFCKSKKEAAKSAELEWNKLSKDERRTTAIIAVEFTQADVDQSVELGLICKDDLNSKGELLNPVHPISWMPIAEFMVV